MGSALPGIPVCVGGPVRAVADAPAAFSPAGRRAIRSPFALDVSPRDGASPGACGAMVGAVLLVHVAVAWNLMQWHSKRDAVTESPPVFVRLVAPPAPAAAPPAMPALPEPPSPAAHVPPSPVAPVPPAPLPAPPRRRPAPAAVPAPPPPRTQSMVKRRLPPVIAAPMRPAPAPVVTSPETIPGAAPTVPALPAAVAAPPVAPAAPVPALPAPAPSPPAPSSPSSPAPPPAAPKVIPASAVQYLEPIGLEYPALSRRLGEAGRVLIRVFIDEAGLARQASVNRSSGHRRLDEAALGAVQNARFKPYTENGRAVAGWAFIPLDFELER